MISTECESCWHYDYDEEFEEYYCMMDLDEDEVYRIMTSASQQLSHSVEYMDNPPDFLLFAGKTASGRTSAAWFP